MSELRVNRIVPKDGLPAGATGGGIIQIVRATDNTAIQINSNTDTDIISATITPASSSNKILISISAVCRSYASGNNRARLTNKILRGSTLVHDIYETPQYRNANFNSSGVEINVPLFFDYLDSPATTSAVTYKYQWASVDGSTFNTGGRAYNMTLMEVSG